MKRIIQICIILIIFSSIAIGQKVLCGISSEEESHLIPDESPALSARNAINYIPIKFHIITNEAGEGAVDYNNLLNQFTRINEDYKVLGFQFYLTDKGDLPILRSTNLFEAPRDFPGELATAKNPNAVNVFLTKNTYDSNSGGTIAAYYTKNGDLIVSQTSYIGDKDVLSHELGHFFSLRHTFYGWEDDPYNEAKHGNPVSLTTAPSYGVEVELVDKSNCKTSADLICDTPPDYNFGYTANGCNFTKKIRDSNGDTIETMKNNFMSYFNACPDFMFTEGQQNAMKNDFSSTSRNYLKKGYVPFADTISETVKLTFPINGQKVETYNNVSLTWTEVTNATRYLVEVTDGKELFRAISLTNSYTFNDLKANKLYVWKVRPYNEGFADTKLVFNTFKTGISTTATNDLTGVNNFVEIFPNPVSSSQAIGVRVKTGISGNYKVMVINSLGQLVQSFTKSLSVGENQFEIESFFLQKGMYFLRFQNNNLDISQKFLIAE